VAQEQQNEQGLPKYADVGELQTLWRKAKTARERWVPDWYLNLSFLAGNQWLFWNGGRLDKPYIDPNRTLVTDNRMRVAVEGRTARKTKNRPTFTGTPRTGDDADVEAAQVAEKVMEADWLNLELERKFHAVIGWSEACCDGFWKIFWDGTKGENDTFLFGEDGQVITHPKDGTPLKAAEADTVLPPEATENAERRQVAQGDAVVEVISPFECFPDPLATSMEDLEWMIEEKVRSLQYVKRRYPTKADGEKFVPHEDASAPTGIMEGRMLAAAFFGENYAEYRGVKVYEYWCKPNNDHPDGHHCVWANDQILVEDEQPFDPMPYVRFPSTPLPGRFWSRPVATDLRKLQEDLNRLETQILENAKRIGNPALMTSRQAAVEYTGKPGERINYDSTVQDAVPTYLEPPRIPAYMENELERKLTAMEEVSGLHEVSRATVPPGVTAASAINLLQEADDTRLGPEIQMIERSLEEAGTKILKLRAKFNTDERTIRLAGEDGDWDIFAFKGALLGETPEISVQAGSGMPRSKAAKQAQMTELLGLAMQYGLPLGQRNLRKFFKDYDVGGLDRLFESTSNDEGQTVREHREMIEGNQIGLNDYDDDKFHIDSHTDFQKTSRYAGLPTETKQLFEAHVNLHRQRLVQQTNLQLQQQGQEAQQSGQADQMAQLEQSQHDHAQGMQQAEQEHGHAMEELAAKAKAQKEAAAARPAPAQNGGPPAQTKPPVRQR
jgi:hypothetical protein